MDVVDERKDGDAGDIVDLSVVTIWACVKRVCLGCRSGRGDKCQRVVPERGRICMRRNERVRLRFEG